MATVIFETISPVNFAALSAGQAYTIDGSDLYRKVSDSTRLNETLGAIENESGATQCYVVDESRITIDVAAA